MVNIPNVVRTAGVTLVTTAGVHVIGNANILGRSDLLKKRDQQKKDRKFVARTDLDEKVQSIRKRDDLSRDEKDSQLKQKNTRFTQQMSDIDSDVSDTEIENDIRVVTQRGAGCSCNFYFKTSKGDYFWSTSKNDTV